MCLGVLHPGSLSVSKGGSAGKIQEGDQEITQQWHLHCCLSPARRKTLSAGVGNLEKREEGKIMRLWSWKHPTKIHPPLPAGLYSKPHKHVTNSLALARGLHILLEDPGHAQWVHGRVSAGSLIFLLFLSDHLIFFSSEAKRISINIDLVGGIPKLSNDTVMLCFEYLLKVW